MYMKKLIELNGDQIMIDFVMLQDKRLFMDLKMKLVKTTSLASC